MNSDEDEGKVLPFLAKWLSVSAVNFYKRAPA